MAIDLNRVIQAAAQAALEESSSPNQGRRRSGQRQGRGLSMPRAILLGAGVFTAGRLVVGSRGRDMLENLQERLIDFEHRHFDGGDDEEPDEYDDEPEAEEDEDFDDEPEAEDDEEPEGEDDEEPEAEGDEEPEAEGDEDFEDEPEEEDEEEPDEERARPGRARSGSGSGARRSRR